MKKSFTILELLIVVALIAILATAAIYLINPIKQIHKGWDAQRKNDLATTKKVLEDYYNDKQCYPRTAEICYDFADVEELTDGSFICHICGNRLLPSALSPYTTKLLCDPQQTVKPFLYHVENDSCPQSYEIYAKLSYVQDPAIAEVGCNMGCGVDSNPEDYTYNYCVSSSNTGCKTQPSAPVDRCSDHTILYQNPMCNTCKSPSSGDNCIYGQPVYSDIACTTQCTP